MPTCIKCQSTQDPFSWTRQGYVCYGCLESKHPPKKTTPTQEKITQEERDYALLELYSIWLQKKGHIDSDWYCEEPKAIDEFLRERRIKKPIKKM